MMLKPPLLARTGTIRWLPKPRGVPRLGGGVRMTLISAWRTGHGIVVNADSQETVGDYRVEVNKIDPIDLGAWKVIVAGSGRPSDLIGSFSIRLSQWMANFASTSIQDFFFRLEKVLARFYKEDVRLCPDPEKAVRFFVPLLVPHLISMIAGQHENTALSSLAADKPELVGWDEPLYKAVVQRLFRKEATLAPGSSCQYLCTCDRGRDLELH